MDAHKFCSPTRKLLNFNQKCSTLYWNVYRTAMVITRYGGNRGNFYHSNNSAYIIQVVTYRELGCKEEGKCQLAPLDPADSFYPSGASPSAKHTIISHTL